MLAVAGIGAVLIASPADPALTWLPLHPLWALVLVLAARYGARGLWLAPALVGALLAADLLVGGGGAAVLDRLSRGGDLAALAAAGLCAAVGTAHERRKALLEERLGEAEARVIAAEASADELSTIAIALRDRCDRSSSSLTFLVDIAVRMNKPDPAAVSEAALELALARSGALGGSLQLADANGHLRMLTSRGPTVLRDLTATAAFYRGAPMSADEVPGVRPEDSDLAAPLLTEDGQVIGVLALRGVPYVVLGVATRADLVAVARWAARSLASTRHEVDPDELDSPEMHYARA